MVLGWAPRIGKTWELLERAQAARARGVDVVVAWLGKPGPAAPAALRQGLEVVAPRSFEFRGLTALEMDVDAVLARQPAVAVVDDLAHVNAPGSRHRRRHDDVQALLGSGIDVLTALDVLHIESLRDVVARLTGREEPVTVPDALLDAADQVLCLDLPVPELTSRLEPGAPWTADILTGLRELALRETAERLARRSAASGARTPLHAGGRLMVALSSLSPRAGTLLRQASRLAGRLNTAWFVVYVETPDESPERVAPVVARTLLVNVEMAREMGAEVVRLRAVDPVPALLDFGRAHGVSTLVVGRSRRWSWRHFWRRPAGATWRGAFGETLDLRVLREARDFDVHLVAQEEQ